MNNEGLVYCRITLRNGVRPNAGEYRVVRGTVLASGTIRLHRGGTTPGVYMACSGWRQPRGRFGFVLQTAYLLGIDLRKLHRRHGPARIDAAFSAEVEKRLPKAVKGQVPVLYRVTRTRDEFERRFLRLLRSVLKRGV